MKLAGKLFSVLAACGIAGGAQAGVATYNIDFNTADIEEYTVQNHGSYVVQANDVLQLRTDSWYAIDLFDTFGLSSIDVSDPLTNVTLDFDFRLFQRAADGGTGGIPNTVPEIAGLFFADFSSGETQAVSSQSFNLAGSQNWGIDDIEYTANRWQSFSIALDEFLTGSFTHIVLVNDCDAECGNVQVRFRDMSLSEVNAPTALSLAVLGLGMLGWRRHRQSA